MDLERLEKKKMGYVECRSANIWIGDSQNIIYDSKSFDHLRQKAGKGNLFELKTFGKEFTQFETADGRPGFGVNMVVDDLSWQKDTIFPVYGFFEQGESHPCFILIDSRDSELRGT